jgi:hypothetical protein
VNGGLAGVLVRCARRDCWTMRWRRSSSAG